MVAHKLLRFFLSVKVIRNYCNKPPDLAGALILKNTCSDIQTSGWVTGRATVAASATTAIGPDARDAKKVSLRRWSRSTRRSTGQEGAR